ncbi:phospholipase A [Luteimonas sp. MC1750]|uniref:phospholipase A n=1 Tax=Luteimonas sp. MC1750 TaxID=2799326 RepID=UPI0018F0F01E|nr:phospholipase A [Luteimonas sp. MC1750]MBJ6984148.1 phospholipase A [Luteimonas sp. MC1750]QQO06950.1 phospholipase A [Luteimonas sp. MC1750]
MERRHTTPLLMLLCAAPLSANAQPAGPEPAPALAACVAVETAAERLACYDRVAQRVAPSPQEADAAAEQAQAVVADAPRQAPETRSDLFPHDGDPRRALANAGRGSLLDSRWELAADSKLGTFNMRAYKPVYLLPAFWSSRPNATPTSSLDGAPLESTDTDSIETKFQISFKTKAVENLFGDNGDIWMGYTQSSRWQVYNTESSRPFRETNYEPEVLLVFRNNYSLGGWKGRMAAVGINHQSNGRPDPVSRSWNRIMFNVGLDREDWAVTFRPWIRISDGSDDDNPGIEDYLGRGDVTVVHTRGDQVFSLMARHSLRGGDRSRGALQFDWGFPISSHLHGHMQLFSGYGESMLDYDHQATYVGFGISVLDWF